MKKILLILIYLVSFQLCYSQESRIDSNDETDKIENFNIIKKGFKELDISLIEKYLSNVLKDEKDSIQKSFDSLKTQIKEKRLVNFSENGSDAYSSSRGTTGYSYFFINNDEFPSVKVNYTYNLLKNKPIIKKITIVINSKVEKQFPLILGKLGTLQKKYNSQKEKLTNEEKIIYLKDITKFSRIASYLDIYPNSFSYRNINSRNLGNLSWYYLKVNQPILAINAASEGINLDYSNKWIFTNIALGHLLNDDFFSAKQIYLMLKDEEISKDRKFKDVFIADIKELKALGVKIPYEKEILDLLE